MDHAYGLNDVEYAAMRALQESSPAPSALDPVWEFLLWSGLVFIDRARGLPVVRLTTAGRNYPADEGSAAGPRG